jgi:hypothetical protein
VYPVIEKYAKRLQKRVQLKKLPPFFAHLLQTYVLYFINQHIGQKEHRLRGTILGQLLPFLITDFHCSMRAATGPKMHFAVSASISVFRLRRLHKEDNEAELNKELFAKLCDSLTALLEDNDPEAIAIVEEVLRLPGIGESRKQFRDIENLVKNYDFDGTLNLLIELRNKIE